MDIKSESEKKAAIKVTGMPGKHVPPGVVGTLNDLVNAVSTHQYAYGTRGKRELENGEEDDRLKAEQVPPTNGWMIELGYKTSDEDSSFQCGYRYVLHPSNLLTIFRSAHLLSLPSSIYISGDTLLVPELAEIPRRYSGLAIDLMLVHLGGTTIPSPSIPLLMVTMDAEMGVQMIKLIDPDVRPSLFILIFDFEDWDDCFEEMNAC